MDEEEHVPDYTWVIVAAPIVTFGVLYGIGFISSKIRNRKYKKIVPLAEELKVFAAENVDNMDMPTNEYMQAIKERLEFIEIIKHM